MARPQELRARRDAIDADRRASELQATIDRRRELLVEVVKVIKRAPAHEDEYIPILRDIEKELADD